MNGVLLKPLPFPESDRLVALAHRSKDGGMRNAPASTALYFIYRDNNHSFESVALWSSGTASVTTSATITIGDMPPSRQRPRSEAESSDPELELLPTGTGEADARGGRAQ